MRGASRGRQSFSLGTGETTRISIPGVPVRRGERVRVTLRSLLGPGVSQTKRRMLAVKVG